MVARKSLKIRTAIASLCLGYVGAWLLMHMHLPPDVLSLHEPNFIRILRGVGAAPDQYRLLQSHLMGVLYSFLDIYWTVATFTALSLAGVIYLFLTTGFPTIAQRHKQCMVVVLTLLYSVVMYPASRGDTAFILLLSLGLAISIGANRKVAFVSLLVLMTLTRGDLALLVALFALLWQPHAWSRSAWLLLLMVPLVGQAVLQFFIFPEAKYYVEVIVVRRNFELKTVASTPVFAFAGGLLVLFLPEMRRFFMWWVRRPLREVGVLALFGAYVVSLVTVALVEETRLFLPLAPFLLLVIERHLQWLATPVERQRERDS